VATALGCLPSAIDEEPAINIFDLLEYWREEPPTHVILAMRYLGPSKRRKPRVSEEDARKDMGEMARLLGQQARPMPANLKDLVRQAEQMKKQHKGM
jgi:hypothetical protein